MVMVYILAEHMPEGALAKEDHPGQRFVFDRADPALGIGIQIRRPRRQWDPRDPSIINDLLKRGAELGISVMHEILARGQEPVWLNNSIALRRFSMIVAEQPTEALPTDHLACLASNCHVWLNRLIAETLMIP